VAEGLFDLITAKAEYAGHAFDIAGRRAHEVAGEPGGQHAENALAIEVLPPMGAHKAKCRIQAPSRVAESRHMRQAIGGEEALGFFLVGQMDERETYSASFDGVFLLG